MTIVFVVSIFAVSIFVVSIFVEIFVEPSWRFSKRMRCGPAGRPARDGASSTERPWIETRDHRRELISKGWRRGLRGAAGAAATTVAGTSPS